MRVRDARPEDVPAIARIHVESWKTTYPGLMPEAYLNDLTLEGRERLTLALPGPVWVDVEEAVAAIEEARTAARSGRWETTRERAEAALGLLGAGFLPDQDGEWVRVRRRGLEELDRRIPLSIARWHAHVNVCLPEGITLDDLARGELGTANPHAAGTLPPGRRDPPGSSSHTAELTAPMWRAASTTVSPHTSVRKLCSRMSIRFRPGLTSRSIWKRQWESAGSFWR